MTAKVIPLPPERDDGGSKDLMGRIPPPMFTKKEAVKSGLCTKRTYKEVLPFHGVTVRHHIARGTPREQWEPMDIVGNKLSEPYVVSADRHLRDSLVRDVDADMNTYQALYNGAEANLHALTKMPGAVSTIETNKTYSGKDAVIRHNDLTERVERDRQDGYSYHDRAPRWLKAIGRFAPWGEGIGTLTFLTYYLNVPILAPLQDPMGWTFAVVLVLYVIVGQTWLVDHAARAHNHFREEYAKGNRHQAEASRRHRGWYSLLAGIVALGITSGLILRGLASIGNVSLSVSAVMVLLALTTGLLMPTLLFLSKALDGSKVSRERDALAVDLDRDLDRFENLRSQFEVNLSAAQEIDHRLTEQTVPEILAETQKRASEARIPYQFLRLQIGGLS